ncbi:DNA adenine methylase [Clostridium sp. 1001275B_160808_H3]|uniref:DNA adenine methylase n=1 Tax=Clostridium sp. 1001275B_160808_H3 TaxID=2787110 RepID=UPI00325FB72C
MKNIKTKDIVKKYDISKPTLNQWIDANKISEPKRDWRGWRIWNESLIEEIEDLINDKKKNSKNRKVKIEKFSLNNRRYLGSKFKLLDFINKIVKDNCEDIRSVADIFGGTGVVADLFYQQGQKIIVNDLLLSNVLAYNTFFSKEKIDNKKLEELINEFNSKKVTEDNYFSLNFGNTFFTLDNSRKIGYIRERIEELKDELNERERAILITSLIFAADKVANTCGHYDAFRETLDTTQEVKLLMPDIKKSESKCEIFREDANELVKHIEADLVYIDTPYNSRQYGDLYHLLENLAEWKKPIVTGKAKKMVDRSNIKSKYCTVKAPQAFDELIGNINSRYILVSYNNMAQKGVGRSNAKISNEEIIETLLKRGKVEIFNVDYNTYNAGKTDIKDHQELLYLCTVEGR